MVTKSFAELHGFSEDPFASTNSETEELLEEYFVPPPYFASVKGDASNPRTSVVFAPRGAGKTAQRRMIEFAASSEPFACITYDSFDISNGTQLSREDHHAQLCRLLTVTILAYLDNYPLEVVELTDHQKRIVKVAAETFVGGLSESEYTRALSAVKTIGDKAGDLWKKYGGVIAAAIAVAMKKAGLDEVSIPAQLKAQAEDFAASGLYFFRQLVEIVRSLGPHSVYILVDKVDETDRTNTDALAAWGLIKSLVTDLPTLEVSGVGFKFFLWDQLLGSFREDGGRPDRVNVLELNWTVAELEEMLAERLHAYSDGTVNSLNELVNPDCRLDVHKLVAYLGNGSPRDMIRMCEAIAAEHTRTEQPYHLMTEGEVIAGIRSFSETRSTELYPKYLGDWVKIGQPSFTINYLANRVFNVSNESARSKVQKWLATGAVEKIGELPNKKNKPLHLYGFTDPRLAIATSPRLELEEVLDNYAIECPSCHEVAYTAENEFTCPRCGGRVEIGSARSLLEICSR